MTTDPQSLEELLGLDSEQEQDPKPTGKDLRSQLTAILAERNALKEQLAQERTVNRARTVADLVTKHSIPALAQELLLREIGDADPTDEAVTGFVAKYGELWGAKAAEASTTPEQQAATRAVQALGQSAQDATGTLFDEDRARATFAEATSKADLMRMVAEATGGYEVAL